eukprot:12945846-Alexandrium_andersonii.AAC.1
MSWATANDLSWVILQTASARLPRPKKPRVPGLRFTLKTTAWKRFDTVISRLRAYDARGRSPVGTSQSGCSSGMNSTAHCLGIRLVIAVTRGWRGSVQPCS